MMYPRKTLLTVSMLAGLCAAVTASAQDWHGGQRGMDRMILSSVQLTAAQKQQIHSIISQARTASRPQMQQLAALHEQTETMMYSTGSLTEAQLAPLLARQETLHQQLDTNRMEAELAVRAVLTSEQLAAASSTQARLASLHAQEHALTATPASDAAP